MTSGSYGSNLAGPRDRAATRLSQYGLLQKCCGWCDLAEERAISTNRCVIVQRVRGVQLLHLRQSLVHVTLPSAELNNARRVLLLHGIR